MSGAKISLMFSRQRGWQLRREPYLHPQGLVPGCSNGMAGHKVGNINPAPSRDGKSRGPSIPVPKGSRVTALLTHTPNCFASLAPALQ